MPRITTTALNGKLIGPITEPGYLLQLQAGAVALKVCDVKQITGFMGDWSHNDFTIKGVGGDALTVDMQNVDNALGGFVLGTTPLAEVLATLWKFDKGAMGDVLDAVKIGEYLPQRATVDMSRVSLTLRLRNMVFKFAPNKRVTPRDGFNFAMRPGEILVWGQQRIFVEERK